jgi:transaldolase
VLIKLAATWEGIRAAESLKKSKIQSNMTLVFHKIQAVACAKSKLFLISPFVGRILDWHKKATGQNYEDPTTDPGVISVTEIYNYFKNFGYDTVVMGASFRNTAEIRELAGCDRLTIAPKLLEELNGGFEEVVCKLDSKRAKEMEIKEIEVNEPIFRYELNKCKMATDLLSEGIRTFVEDGEKLKEMIRKCLGVDIKEEGEKKE